MRWVRAFGPLAATFLLGILGLVAPGPLGDVAAFAWLGLFPGLALARLLMPLAPRATRWTLGAALAPLVSAGFGWALLQAGHPMATAARLVGMGGWILFAGGEARLLHARTTDDDAPGDRGAWGWMLLAVAFVALPMLLSEWARVRSDGWVHAGLVWEIAERGVPPQDPRFAGLPLNYVWFYNLFLALVVSLRPDASPFTAMTTANVVWMGVVVWLGFQIAWALARTRAAARTALPLLLLGLNAGALFLWPLWLLRAARGEVRGMSEVARIVREARWDGVEVMHQLCAPFAWMVNAWDKYMVGTALGYAYLLLLVTLWASLRWLSDARAAGTTAAWRWLVVVFASSAGMMLFHSVVGLSAIPVSLGACVLMALLATREPRLGPPARPLALAGALAAGLAVALPYFRSIVRGWDAGRSGVKQSFLHLDVFMPWTLVTACGLVLWLAWPSLRRLVRERTPGGVWLVCWLFGMTLFALVVQLPEHNEFKFVWMVFAPLALVAGGSAGERITALQRRLGPTLAGVLLFVAFVLPSLLLLRGFLRDPAAATAAEVVRAPGDAACYAWIRTTTPRDAVFLDHRSRDVLLVEGRRRLLAGTPYGPERAAFPAEALARRRAVMADLYGPAVDLAGDAACLDSLNAPAYVLYRAEDFAGARPWAALDADSLRFDLVYDAAGRRVYRRRAS